MRNYDAGFIAGFMMALLIFLVGFGAGYLLSKADTMGEQGRLVLTGILFGGWLGALWHSLRVERTLEEKGGGGGA